MSYSILLPVGLRVPMAAVCMAITVPAQLESLITRSFMTFHWNCTHSYSPTWRLSRASEIPESGSVSTHARLANSLTVSLVTGSSQGLGRALLEEVLEAGERAVATVRRPEALDELATRYPTSQLLVVALDVTNEQQIVDAFAAAKEHFGRLDVVVNNAGYGIQSEIEGTPEPEARRIVETLFWGPVHITKEVGTDTQRSSHAILNVHDYG